MLIPALLQCTDYIHRGRIHRNAGHSTSAGRKPVAWCQVKSPMSSMSSETINWQSHRLSLFEGLGPSKVFSTGLTQYGVSKGTTYYRSSK